jgi:hypothetical protein
MAIATIKNKGEKMIKPIMAPQRSIILLIILPHPSSGVRFSSTTGKPASGLTSIFVA